MDYKCPKCGYNEYIQEEMRATGGLWSKIFNIQNKRFFSVSCKKCGYAEFII